MRFDSQRLEKPIALPLARVIWRELFHALPVYQTDELDGKVIKALRNFLRRQGLVVVHSTSSICAVLHEDVILLQLAIDIAHSLRR